LVVTAYPSPSTATHLVAELHETPVRSAGSSIPPAISCHELSTAGSVEVAAWPKLPTATQKLADGHEIALNPPGVSLVLGSTLLLVQVPPIGSVETTTLPAESTATHSVVVGHDTPVSGWVSIGTRAEKLSGAAASAGALASAPPAITNDMTATKRRPDSDRDLRHATNMIWIYSLNCTCFG
jgi:hypothetical protein